MPSFDSAAASPTGVSGAAGIFLDWNHTIAANATLLVVGIVDRNGANQDTVTVNGKQMTRINFGAGITSFFYCEDPPTGVVDIRLTLGIGGGRVAYGMSASYIGLGVPIDSFNDNHNTLTNTITTSTTAVGSSVWAIGFGMGARLNTVVITSDQTDRTHEYLVDGFDSSGTGAVLSDSNGALGSGSHSIVHSMTGIGAVEILMAAIYATFGPYVPKINPLFIMSD